VKAQRVRGLVKPGLHPQAPTKQTESEYLLRYGYLPTKESRETFLRGKDAISLAAHGGESAQNWRV